MQLLLGRNMSPLFTALLGAALMGILACERLNTRAGLNESPTDAPAGMIAAPMEFCTDLKPRQITAVVASVIPSRPKPTVEEADSAALINALGIGPRGRFYVLDSRARQVVGFDSQGVEFTRWGRDGEGPGEFKAPVALTVDAAGDVYVLDSRVVSVFDSLGVFQRSFPVAMPGNSIAITSAGDAVVARSLYARNPGKKTYVARVNDKLELNPLLTYDDKMLGSRPLIAPVHNRVAVTAGPDNAVAVWYYYDPTVLVFRNDRIITTVRGCIENSVVDAYAAQAKIGGRTYQGSFMQTSGVWLDPNGEVYFITTNRSERYGRISRYDAHGKAIAVYDFPFPDGRILRGRISFVGSPRTFVAWDEYGITGATGAVDAWQVDLPN